MGTVTPQIGIDDQVVREMAGDMPVSRICRGVIPILFLEVLLTVIVLFIPETVLWLPGLAP